MSTHLHLITDTYNIIMYVLQAKRYLVKVNYYKESGFSEKSIHEAYEKAGKDWDRALDILTQNSS